MKPLSTLLLPAVLMTCPILLGQQAVPDIRTVIAGHWQINDELSQNTDERVEVAIREAGGRVQRRGLFGRRQEDRYRGGPADQELYDRISYDDILTITHEAPELVFEYADGFQRVFYTDGRRRSTGVNDYFEQGGEDYSFGGWSGNSLTVEARPRDGGYTLETYTLEAEGQRLRVEMTISPFVFAVPITLVRIYDRVAGNQGASDHR